MTIAHSRKSNAAMVVALAATGAVSLSLTMPAAAAPSSKKPSPKPGAGSISGSVLGSYRSGFFDVGGAEIVAHDPKRQRLFAVNAAAGTLDVLSIKNPAKPTRVAQLATPGANSVAVRGDAIAVAQQADKKTDPGTVAFFSARTLKPTKSVTVGSLPDMVTITANGRYAVVANEGEPEGYCAGQVDPRGSVSVIDLSRGKKPTVRTASFTKYDGREAQLRAAGVQIYGPNASASQDLEPEYVTTSGDKAWVTLQENNAIATVDLRRAQVTSIKALGLKDHSKPGNALDVNDKDGVASLVNRPVKGKYSPDSIANVKFRGQNYLFTANEGDARDWECYAEEARVKDLTLDPSVFPNAKAVKQDSFLGRLTVTTSAPQSAAGYRELWALGARSMSVWDARGDRLWDAGNLLEEVTAKLPSYNANHSETNSLDSRSDNKGPEPEGLAIGRIKSKTYAFVGLERTSAVAIFDVTNPRQPSYAGLLSNRNDKFPAQSSEAGDLGPEGLHFVAAKDSPNRKPLLVVGNEVSGTTTVWQLNGR